MHATVTPADARAEYGRRLGERRAEAERLRGAETRMSILRLVLFLAAVGLVWPALFGGLLSPAWILLPVALFAAAVVRHARLIAERERVDRAVAFYEGGLARLDDRWAGRGNPGNRFRDAHHPYSGDLDLFGHGSVFELLSAARTTPGEATLARWLLNPADAATVRARQEAVRELASMLDLRERLAIVGEEIRQELVAEELTEWARTPHGHERRWAPWLGAALAVVNMLALATALANGVWIAFFVAVAASAAFVLFHRPHVRTELAGVERPERELELLARVLEELERATFRAPLLVELRAGLTERGHPASRSIAHLARLIQIHDSRRNMMFAPVAGLLLAGTQIAFAVERWRRAHGSEVERWIAAVGRIEALASLARQAFEHPADPFPEIAEAGPCFAGEQLGHPLLPDAACVRNDVKLDGELQLLLVSGSNMSGKSTLLRTVGVNTVLALAGAPVRATSLRVSSMAVGASMRVTDSLQEGLSHFYAEIQRLRAIVELEPPLLFLLDEILQGTNSQDRRVGAEAVIRGLVGRGGIGLVTTHDLALAQIADDLAPRAANVHFEDQLDNGRISFDYRLRPGVVTRGNALGLMRAIGLPV
jgi:hypothetical protein